MSISEPSIRILTLSPLAFSSFPRRGPFTSPETTCKTTGKPIQLAYAMSIALAPEDRLLVRFLQSVLTQAESRTAQKPPMGHGRFRRSKNVLLYVVTPAFC